MEESEKRRERLRAMRNEASEAEGSPSFQSPAGTGVLANPLVETPIVQDSHATSRFDYYTDPMAAYSGNKRPNNFSQSSRDNPMSHGGGGGNPMMQFPPSPSGPGNPQMTSQPNFSHQGMQHGWRPPFYGSGPIRSPMPVFNPHPEHQHHGFSNQPVNPSGHYLPGNTSGGLHMPRPDYWVNNSMTTNPGRGGTPFPDPGRGRSRGHWTNNGPNPGGSDYWVNSGVTTNPGRGGTPFPNPGRGRSRGHWTNNSKSPGGSGSGYSSGGRGVGYRGNNTAQSNLYRKSMVEDPWNDLKPVFWRPVSSELLQKLSSGAKKPRVEEAYSVPKSESLAGYLAAAFQEAVEEGDAL